MVDFGESDKMIKVSGEVDKFTTRLVVILNPNTYNGFSDNILFFIHKKTSSELTFFFSFFLHFISWRNR